MFVEVHTPSELTAHELDAYLERGWFRMGQTIFTTNFAHVKDAMHSTVWLRVLLREYIPETAHIKLLRKNAEFETIITQATVTEEKEELYARYRQSLEFPVSESLHHLLFGKNATNSIYSTYEITVRDNQRLIGCGFFDLGQNSAQGIVSFYDPAYKKYSLGRYLIYSKIQFCKELDLHYFYPGYFVPGNPYFDYKLNIGREALHFLSLGTGEWRHIKTFSEGDVPVRIMQTKLIQLQHVLWQAGVESRVLMYEFFDANLIPDMRNSGLLDFPWFLQCGAQTDEIANVIIVFDVRDNQYHLQICAPVWKPDRTNPDPGFYSAYFLKPVQDIEITPNAEELVNLLTRINQRISKAN